MSPKTKEGWFREWIGRLNGKSIYCILTTKNNKGIYCNPCQKQVSVEHFGHLKQHNDSAKHQRAVHHITEAKTLEAHSSGGKKSHGARQQPDELRSKLERSAHELTTRYALPVNFMQSMEMQKFLTQFAEFSRRDPEFPVEKLFCNNMSSIPFKQLASDIRIFFPADYDPCTCPVCFAWLGLPEHTSHASTSSGQQQFVQWMAHMARHLFPSSLPPEQCAIDTFQCTLCDNDGIRFLSVDVILQHLQERHPAAHHSLKQIQHKYRRVVDTKQEKTALIAYIRSRIAAFYGPGCEDISHLDLQLAGRGGETAAAELRRKHAMEIGGAGQGQQSNSSSNFHWDDANDDNDCYTAHYQGGSLDDPDIGMDPDDDHYADDGNGICAEQSSIGRSILERSGQPIGEKWIEAGEDEIYVDKRGKQWRSVGQLFEDNAEFSRLCDQHGLRLSGQCEQTINLRCKFMNSHRNRVYRCQFRGIFLRENKKLYVHGEHNHPLRRHRVVIPSVNKRHDYPATPAPSATISLVASSSSSLQQQREQQQNYNMGNVMASEASDVQYRQQQQQAPSVPSPKCDGNIDTDSDAAALLDIKIEEFGSLAQFI